MKQLLISLLVLISLKSFSQKIPVLPTIVDQVNGTNRLFNPSTDSIVGIVHQPLTLTLNGVSQNLNQNRSWTITGSKRIETYSGTTNAGGNYSTTFPIAYSVAPNIQANIINGTNTNLIKITSISTTGFTVNVVNRTDALGLLPTYANVNGAAVDVLITEK